MAVVVTSVPLEGPTAQAGRHAAAAAALAVDDAGTPVEHRVLDAGSGFIGRHVSENARQAAADPDVIGYVGELHSASTEYSLPVLEAAGVPHISFSNTSRRLVGACFVNVMPTDVLQARGLVAWMRELGVRRPFLVDDGDDYGADMRWLVHTAVAAAGLRVAGAVRLNGRTAALRGIEGADGAFLGAVGEPQSVETVTRLHAAAPHLPIFGMEGLVYDDFAAALPESAAARVHVTTGPAGPESLPTAGRELTARLAGELGEEPDPHAVYAYEAISLLLGAITQAGADRAAVITRLRATRARDSVLGRYDIDAGGATTLATCGRLLIRDGAFARA